MESTGRTPAVLLAPSFGCGSRYPHPLEHGIGGGGSSNSGDLHFWKPISPFMGKTREIQLGTPPPPYGRGDVKLKNARGIEPQVAVLVLLPIGKPILRFPDF